MQTIDLTPTWSAMLPSMIALLNTGKFEPIKIATEELERMAKLADAYVALMTVKN